MRNIKLGYGAEVDEKKAAGWYTLAAYQGNNLAIKALAKMEKNGCCNFVASFTAFPPLSII